MGYVTGHTIYTDFVLPSILPDELLAGYRGRIAAFNGLVNAREVADALAVLYPAAARWRNRTTTFINAAALANNMKTESLLQQHSCFPLLGRRIGSAEQLETDRSLSTLHSMALYNPDHHVRGCTECNASDLRGGQLSRWRRSHQIPGRLFCPVHGCDLWLLHEQDLLIPDPASATDKKPIFDGDQLQRIGSSKNSIFTVKLLEEILDRGIDLDAFRCVDYYKRRLGLSATEHFRCGDVMTLGDAVMKAFEPEWLALVLSSYGDLRKTVRTLVRNFVSTPSYQKRSLVHAAMIGSLLFGSVEEAILEMTSKS